eukprot:gene12605-15831_t
MDAASGEIRRIAKVGFLAQLTHLGVSLGAEESTNQNGRVDDLVDAAADRLQSFYRLTFETEVLPQVARIQSGRTCARKSDLGGTEGTQEIGTGMSSPFMMHGGKSDSSSSPALEPSFGIFASKAISPDLNSHLGNYTQDPVQQDQVLPPVQPATTFFNLPFPGGQDAPYVDQGAGLDPERVQHLLYTHPSAPAQFRGAGMMHQGNQPAGNRWPGQHSNQVDRRETHDEHASDHGSNRRGSMSHMPGNLPQLSFLQAGLSEQGQYSHDPMPLLQFGGPNALGCGNAPSMSQNQLQSMQGMQLNDGLSEKLKKMQVHSHSQQDRNQYDHDALASAMTSIAGDSTGSSQLSMNQLMAALGSHDPQSAPGNMSGAGLDALFAAYNSHPGYPTCDDLLVPADHFTNPGQGLPPRFAGFPPPVQRRLLELTHMGSVLKIQDFDEKVTNKMALMVERYGEPECLIMLDKLAGRLKTKMTAMKNGPGYLDVAVSSHLDVLMAHRYNPQPCGNMLDYARCTLGNTVYDELSKTIENNPWLRWEVLDESIIHQLKKLPTDIATERLMEVSLRSFRHVDNVSGCIKSILSSRNQYNPGRNSHDLPVHNTAV